MIILAFDPGSINSGYAVLRKSGNQIDHLASGTLRFNSKTPFLKRLQDIKLQVAEVVKKFGPCELALESLIFVKDPRAIIKLSQTRGVIIAEAMESCGTRIYEYPPNVVKATVTGHGHATKESVQKVVKMMLKMESFEGFDHSDALAVGLCHALCAGKISQSSPSQGKTRTGSLKSALSHKI